MSVKDCVGAIEVIIQGELPDAVSESIAEEVRANVERAIKRQCILQRV